ncbi:MAG: GC-type dockerin domain-anchored protein, partial [Planctomycetota bacterium]
EVIYSDRAGSGLELEYRTGMQVPGLPAGAFYRSLRGYMNDDLTIGFIADVSATQTTPEFTAFFTEVGPAQVNQAITLGDQVPGYEPGVVVDAFSWAKGSESRGDEPAFSPAGFPAVEVNLLIPSIWETQVTTLTAHREAILTGVEIGATVETSTGPRTVDRSFFDIDLGINRAATIASTARLSGARAIIVAAFPEPCLADTNGDGQLVPNDFTAWVLAFNTNAPACDQNGDGSCDPRDFNAWVVNFNAGC